jgi:high frequency lysogenization protein
MSQTSIKDQVLALAGIAQAAILASQLAREGNADNIAMAGTVHSILMLDAPNTESVFLDHKHLQTGLRFLRDAYENKGNPNHDIMRYCASLLHLQRQVTKNSEMLSTIRRRIQQVQKQVEMHGSETHSQIIGNIAALYSDTLSTLTYRIQINGNQKFLQQDNVANQIRTVLLGGIRAAMLWQQLGGSRFDLLFKRKAIYNAALSFIEA